MRHEDEEADGHRTVGLRQILVAACEEFVQRDEVSQALAHLLAVDRDHVVVHPVAHHITTLTGDSLGNLAFVVGEDEVHAAAVDVELRPKVLFAHGRTFAMPAWEAVAPRAGPAHDVFGLRLFPEGKVNEIVLLALPIQIVARGVDDVLQITSGETAVMVGVVVLGHIEIDAALALVGKAIGEDVLDQLNLLDDVP